MFDSPRIFHRDLTHFGVIMEQNNYRLNLEMIIGLETLAWLSDWGQGGKVEMRNSVIMLIIMTHIWCRMQIMLISSTF